VSGSKNQDRRHGRVLKKRMIAVVALSIPVIGVTAVDVNPASATPKGIICAKARGSADVTADTSKIAWRTCSGNTGGSGKATGRASSVLTSETIKWKNGKATSWSISSSGLGTGAHCLRHDSAGFALVDDASLSGSVSADTTNSTAVQAAVSAELCVYNAPSGFNGDTMYAITGPPAPNDALTIAP
jgi:hypothetical protein